MTGPDRAFGSSATPRPTFGARRRVAMLSWATGGMIGWALVLILVDVLVVQGPAETIFVDTLWWSLAAFVATSLMIDRSIHAPTAEGGIWVAFSTAVSFVGLLILFAVSHAAYSRSALTGAFLLQTAWLLLGVRLHMRLQVLRLGVPSPRRWRC